MLLVYLGTVQVAALDPDDMSPKQALEALYALRDLHRSEVD